MCYFAPGMQCVLDKASAPVCALAFGRLDSALLAFGADDGVVRVARINEQKASILHVRWQGSSYERPVKPDHGWCRSDAWPQH